MSPRRVPVEDILDLARVRADGRPPTLREIRAALPRGLTLDDDGRHVRRDARLLFREGWILALGLVLFGGVGGWFLVDAAPRGLGGVLQIALLFALVAVAGGIVAPLVTRALYRRR